MTDTPAKPKTKVDQLTDALFDRLHKMRDPSIRGSELQDELRRNQAIVSTSDAIIKAWTLQVDASKIIATAQNKSIAIAAVGHLTGSGNDSQG